MSLEDIGVCFLFHNFQFWLCRMVYVLLCCLLFLKYLCSTVR